MTTITAKQLRNNLEEIVRRVRAGEEIRVTYREKPAFRILPESQYAAKGKVPVMAGLDAFLASVPMQTDSTVDSASYKKLYNQHLQQKYGDYLK